MSNLKKFIAGFATTALVLSGVLVAAPASAATAGGVYKTTDGTVWFVTKDMQKRPFTSAGAFMSYGFLSFSQVQEADSSVTALPTGSFIAPQDGRIFCATETKASDVSGECSLITGGKKAAFTSASVFTGQGYSFSRAYYGDSSFLEKTSNIENASAQHRPGTLINNNGTIQLVVSGGLWGVPSMDVFNAWGWSFADVVPANSADVLLSQTGIIPARQAGELVPTATTNPGTGNGQMTPGLEATAFDASLLALPNAVEVGAGETDKVIGVKLEADGSAVEVQRVDVAFDGTGNADLRPWRTFDRVVLYMNGTQIASKNFSGSSDFTKNGDIYTLRVTDLSSIVPKDGSATLEVGVRVKSDAADAQLNDQVWNLEIPDEGVRGVDGIGQTQFSDGAVDRNFTVVDDTAAALSVTLSADENPDSSIILVKTDAITSKQTLLAFDVENTEDSDAVITDMEVELTAGDSANDKLSDIASVVYLYNGNTLVGAEAVPTGLGLNGKVAFNDIDVDIDGDETLTFTVQVDLKSRINANYNEGEDIFAEVAGADIDFEYGDEETASGTGSAEGELMYLYSIAPQVTAGTMTGLTLNEAGTQASGTIKFDVTAMGGDVFIDATTVNGAVGVVLGVSGPANDNIPVGSYFVDATNATKTAGPGNNWKILKNQTATFTITVTLTQVVGADEDPAFYRIQVNNIEWNSTDEAGGADTFTVPADLLEDLKTQPVTMFADGV